MKRLIVASKNHPEVVDIVDAIRDHLFIEGDGYHGREYQAVYYLPLRQTAAEYVVAEVPRRAVNMLINEGQLGVTNEGDYVLLEKYADDADRYITSFAELYEFVKAHEHSYRVSKDSLNKRIKHPMTTISD